VLGSRLALLYTVKLECSSSYTTPSRLLGSHWFILVAHGQSYFGRAQAITYEGLQSLQLGVLNWHERKFWVPRYLLMSPF